MGDVLAEALVRRPRQAVLVALQRRKANDRLERMARRDALTGVANRAHFIDRLDALAAGGSPYGVCYVDLDRFKEVNDTRGHLAGDEALVTCAARIAEVVGPDAAVGRLGGDEFAVAVAVADEVELGAVVAALAEPVALTGATVVVGASVGAARRSAPTDRRHDGGGGRRALRGEAVGAFDVAAGRAGRGPGRSGGCGPGRRPDGVRVLPVRPSRPRPRAQKLPRRSSR